MAKKKDKDEEVIAEGVDGFLASMQKEYGEGFVSANNFLQRPRRIIPFSPSLDGIGCQIPEGSWATFAGKPKWGKTSIALWFASKAQRPENGDKHIFYLNIEGRLKPMNLNGTKGLNPSKFTIIESTEDKIYSAQDYLNIGEKILLGNKKAVLIIDSYSAVAPEAELVGGVGTSTRGGNAVLLAQFTRQMANVVPVKGHIVIGITHLMANTSGYGSPYSEKGGQAIAYQVDVKLMAKKLEDWLEDGKQIGQIVTWESGCTATGAPPGQTCQTYIRYGMGIDEVAELSAIGQEFGLVGKAGAWYTLDFLEYHLDKIDETEWNDEVKRKYKYQGEAKLLAGLRANEEIQKLLYEEIKKLYEV